jgi:hypothetical protein
MLEVADPEDPDDVPEQAPSAMAARTTADAERRMSTLPVR